MSSFFDNFGRKVADSVNLMQQKTSDSLAVYKLQTRIKGIESEKEGLYASIGRAVFAARKDGTEPVLDDFFAAIDSLDEAIASVNDEIRKIGEVRRCPKCGRELAEGVLFCPRCGAKAEEPAADGPAHCPVCGAERASGARFCNKCGHDFSSFTAVVNVGDAEKPAGEEKSEDNPPE